MEGLYYLKSLEYLVIKKEPKDIALFNETILSLCKYSPIKQVSLLFKYKKSKHYDYWQNTKSISVKSSKNNLHHHHPNYVIVNNLYNAPPFDTMELAEKNRFSAYMSKKRT